MLLAYAGAGVVTDVLVLGHFYVRRAQSVYFAGNYMSPALKDSYRLTFCSQVGLRLAGMRTALDRMLPQRLTLPGMIIVHIGGNDIAELGRRDLCELIIFEMCGLAKKFLGATIVWSNMIPRSKWRGGKSVKAINESQKRLNLKLGRLFRTDRLSAISHGCIKGERFPCRMECIFLMKVTPCFLKTCWPGCANAIWVVGGGQIEGELCWPVVGEVKIGGTLRFLFCHPVLPNLTSAFMDPTRGAATWSDGGGRGAGGFWASLMWSFI